MVSERRPAPAPDPQILAHALVACAEQFAASRSRSRRIRVILGALWPSTR
ncbi:hypothetical protein [Streptomyces longisporus]